MSILLQSSDSCVAQTVILLVVCEHSLDGFLPLRIDLLPLLRISNLFRFLHVIRPHMPQYILLAALGLCALIPKRTGAAYCRIALVVPVSLTVCCRVAQHLIVRAQIAVILLVIDVFMFPEEAFLCHWPLIWEERRMTVQKNLASNCRCLIAGIQADILDLAAELIS